MSVSFTQAMETLQSMFPELDVVTIRDVLDTKGGHMESSVEELLKMSRAKRGMGQGISSGGGAGDAPGQNQMGGRG
jgi:hypothetical protein